MFANVFRAPECAASINVLEDDGHANDGDSEAQMLSNERTHTPDINLLKQNSVLFSLLLLLLFFIAFIFSKVDVKSRFIIADVDSVAAQAQVNLNHRHLFIFPLRYVLYVSFIDPFRRLHCASVTALRQDVVDGIVR